MRLDTHACADVPQRSLVSDVGDITDQEVAAACETAYRRGFAQGIWAVIEGLEEGRTLAEIHRYYRRIRRWRYKRHRGKVERPEWLAR